jgi:hypothetical protein
VETFLNLAWVALAIAMIFSWLRLGNEDRTGRRRQMVALAVLIAVLLPVISVSDDLMEIQNPAETDSCQRRDHHMQAMAHPVPHPDYVAPLATFDGSSFTLPRGFARASMVLPAVDHPDGPATHSRPPPTV